MAYLTTDDIKLYLGATTATDDDMIDALIAAAQAYIEGPLGAQRVFEASTDTTRYFDAVCDVDGRTLRLDRDLASITSIVNGDGSTIASTEYVTEPRNSTPYYAITLKSGASTVWQWTTSPENAIAITGKWAYSTTAPEKAKQWMREIVAYLYRRRDSSGDADRPLLTGDGVMILPGALPRKITLELMAERRKT